MAATRSIEPVRWCSAVIRRVFGVFAVGGLLAILCSAPAMAKGGGGHGIGGAGFHGGIGQFEAPAYVLIMVSSLSDADAFNKAILDMTAAVAPFTGHLAVDADKPTAWDGTAPLRVVMIRFADAEQADAWKNSDAFKNFDTELHTSSTSTIQLVQDLPMPEAHGRGGRRGLDARAFEPSVKDYDRLLDRQLKTICKGC